MQICWLGPLWEKFSWCFQQIRIWLSRPIHLTFWHFPLSSSRCGAPKATFDISFVFSEKLESSSDTLMNENLPQVSENNRLFSCKVTPFATFGPTGPQSNDIFQALYLWMIFYSHKFFGRDSYRRNWDGCFEKKQVCISRRFIQKSIQFLTIFFRGSIARKRTQYWTDQ